MKNWISAVGLAILAIATQAQTTCVDPLACNFTELGECEFLDDNGMPCVTEGCAIPGACNFNPEADINDGSCEFTSCLGCTDEAACNYDPEAVYLDLSCIYFVDCNGVCGGDWIEDECGNCYELGPNVDTQIITLTSCGATGRLGPSQGACDAVYGSNVVSVSGGIQTWVVPEDGRYLFRAAGAQGGGASGGLGARISAQFELEEGEEIKVIVGQQGGVTSQSPYWCAGGGGGTFLWKHLNELPLLVAGGGGGQSELNGSESAHGGDGSGSEECTAGNGTGSGQGGVNGMGGQGGSNTGVYSTGGGGAGWFENGFDGLELRNPEGKGGKSPSNGATGGEYLHPSYEGAHGGFGGGGGASDNTGAGGGGGGYSGGGGGNNYNNNSVPRWGSGGGGSSFIAEGSIENSSETGVNSGNGFVEIVLVSPIVPECELGCVVDQACNFNPEATNDDGSCDFCFCGPGTEYDIELGQCMIVNGSSDINGDGCTNLGDLLDLLSGYGTCED